MKNTLRFFAILDFISIVLLSPQLYKILINTGDIIKGISISMVFTILTYLLLFISAIRLFMLSKWGLIIYYIQFPMRLVAWIFSFGFLTLLSEYYSNPSVFEWLLRFVFMLEVFRLYFTVRIHKQYFSS